MEMSFSTEKYTDLFCFEKFGDYKCEKVNTCFKTRGHLFSKVGL